MKILVIAVQGIGNTLLAVPMLKRLHGEFPEAKIDLLTIKPTDSLLGNCPYIDRTFTIDKKVQENFSRNFSTLMQLRREKYDVSITAFPAKQFHFNVLACLIRAKKRITHNYNGNLLFLQNMKVPMRILHDVEQNVNLLGGLGVGGLGVGRGERHKLELWLTKKEQKAARSFLKKKGIGGNFVGMHPGSSIEGGMISKRWPIEKFAEISDMIVEKLCSRVLVFLGPDEAELFRLEKLVKNKDSIFIIQEPDIRKVASLIGACRLFVSNDSGLMHMAVAGGVPTIGVFGSTDWRRTAPYGKKHIIIKKDLSCMPCSHSLERLGKKFKCIHGNFLCFEKISADEVFKACEKLWRKKKR